MQKTDLPQFELSARRLYQCLVRRVRLSGQKVVDIVCTSPGAEESQSLCRVAT